MAKISYNKEQLVNIINNSKTYKEILDKLNLTEKNFYLKE